MEKIVPINQEYSEKIIRRWGKTGGKLLWVGEKWNNELCKGEMRGWNNHIL